MPYQDPKTIGSRDFTLRLMYGSTLGSHDPEMQLRLAKAIMIIAAADGELSPAEWAALIGGFRAVQMPDSMLEELARFDPRSSKLEDYLSQDYKHLKAPARIMLYTAIWISRADGHFAAEERAMAARAAKILGIDGDMLAALEGLAEVEAATAAARAALLFPDLRKPEGAVSG
jgi:tellurite resistance protein